MFCSILYCYGQQPTLRWRLKPHFGALAWEIITFSLITYYLNEHYHLHLLKSVLEGFTCSTISLDSLKDDPKQVILLQEVFNNIEVIDYQIIEITSQTQLKLMRGETVVFHTLFWHTLYIASVSQYIRNENSHSFQ